MIYVGDLCLRSEKEIKSLFEKYDSNNEQYKAYKSLVLCRKMYNNTVGLVVSMSDSFAYGIQHITKLFQNGMNDD